MSKVLEGRLCFRSDVKGSRIRRHLAKFIGQKKMLEMLGGCGNMPISLALRQDLTCISLVRAHLMSRVTFRCWCFGDCRYSVG